MKRPSLLFAGRTARKSRMTIMVAGSVLAHTVLVAVGTMWQPPSLPPSKEREYKDVIIEEPPKTDGESGAPTAPPSTPVAATPPEIAVVAPSPAQIEESTESNTPVPTPRAVRTPVRSVRTAPVTSHANSNGPQTAMAATGTGSGTSAVGIGRGQTGWNTPHPSYPPRAQQMRLQGSTTVRVRTDASGNVVEVVIVKSAGNILLDSATQSFVRSHWKGPANSTLTTEFVYQMP